MTQPNISALTPTSLADSPRIVVVYHSVFGHTQRVAEAIVQGAVSHGVATRAFSVDEFGDNQSPAWDMLDAAQVLVFGCPTYMGSVSAELKCFMDASSGRWVARKWLGKWAAGFTVSGGLSGDKQGVLLQLFTFAMQHGMNWAGLPLTKTGNTPEDLNRLASYSGLMCQADDAPVDVTPPVGDIKTAQWFGKHLGDLLS